MYIVMNDERTRYLCGDNLESWKNYLKKKPMYFSNRKDAQAAIKEYQKDHTVLIPLKVILLEEVDQKLFDVLQKLEGAK